MTDQCACPENGASSACPTHGDRPLTTEQRTVPYDFATHWLKEQVALTKAQLRRCTNAMELIANSETSYAKGHRVMIEAHTKALAVYEAELAKVTS